METKEETQEMLDEKEKSKPFWETVHPVILIGAAILIVMALRSLMVSESGNYMWIVIAVIVVIIIMSNRDTKDESILHPREAELLVERDLERKQRWGQIPMMAKCSIGVVGELMHRDARGKYYNIDVIIKDPFRKVEHLVAKVMAAGPEKKIVTFIKPLSRLTGREVRQEKDITKVPGWVKSAGKYDVLEKIWGMK